MESRRVFFVAQVLWDPWWFRVSKPIFSGLFQVMTRQTPVSHGHSFEISLKHPVWSIEILSMFPNWNPINRGFPSGKLVVSFHPKRFQEELPPLEPAEMVEELPKAKKNHKHVVVETWKNTFVVVHTSLVVAEIWLVEWKKDVSFWLVEWCW